MARVLLVESASRLGNGLTQALTKADHDVTETASPTFALTMLEWDRPDLIVSRIDLEEMDGFDLCAVVRSDPKIKDIPFLLLAGPEGPVAGQAARVGVDMVLAGSFVAADVVRAVGRLT